MDVDGDYDSLKTPRWFFYLLVGTRYLYLYLSLPVEAGCQTLRSLNTREIHFPFRRIIQRNFSKRIINIVSIPNEIFKDPFNLELI